MDAFTDDFFSGHTRSSLISITLWKLCHSGHHLQRRQERGWDTILLNVYGRLGIRHLHFKTVGKNTHLILD